MTADNPQQPTDSTVSDDGAWRGLRELTGHLLRLSHLRAQAAFAEAFDGTGLSPIQYAVLHAVSDTPGLAQRTIAEAIGTSPSVLVGAMRDLLDRDLLTRATGADDRRRAAFHATPAGRAMVAEGRIRIVRAEASLTQALTAPEQASLIALLRKLTEGKAPSASNPEGGEYS